MNTGMQDAFNLAWKLASVFRNSCDEHLLDSYSPERSAVGDEVLKSAAMLTTVGTMKNPVAQTLRNLVGHIMLGLPPVQHAFADTMTEVTIGYPKSPLNGPCLGPTPLQSRGSGSDLCRAKCRSGPAVRRVSLFSRQTPPLRPILWEDFQSCWIATFARLSAMAAFGWFGLTAISPVRQAIRKLSPIT